MPEEQGPCALQQDAVDAATVDLANALEAVDAAINAYAAADAVLMERQIALQNCITENNLNQLLQQNTPMEMVSHSDKVTEASVRLKFEHVFGKKNKPVDGKK